MDDAKISDGASTAAWTMGEISSADWAIDPTSKSTSDGSALLQQAAASGLSLAGTTASALADTITLHLSEYAQQGNAQVLISVDGTPLDGVQTIVAQRALGLSQTLTFLEVLGQDRTSSLSSSSKMHGTARQARIATSTWTASSSMERRSRAPQRHCRPVAPGLISCP